MLLYRRFYPIIYGGSCRRRLDSSGRSVFSPALSADHSVSCSPFSRVSGVASEIACFISPFFLQPRFLRYRVCGRIQTASILPPFTQSQPARPRPQLRFLPCRQLHCFPVPIPRRKKPLRIRALLLTAFRHFKLYSEPGFGVCLFYWAAAIADISAPLMSRGFILPFLFGQRLHADISSSALRTASSACLFYLDGFITRTFSSSAAASAFIPSASMASLPISPTADNFFNAAISLFSLTRRNGSFASTPPSGCF